MQQLHQTDLESQFNGTPHIDGEHVLTPQERHKQLTKDEKTLAILCPILSDDFVAKIQRLYGIKVHYYKDGVSVVEGRDNKILNAPLVRDQLEISGLIFRLEQKGVLPMRDKEFDLLIQIEIKTQLRAYSRFTLEQKDKIKGQQKELFESLLAEFEDKKTKTRGNNTQDAISRIRPQDRNSVISNDQQNSTVNLPETTNKRNLSATKFGLELLQHPKIIKLNKQIYDSAIDRVIQMETEYTENGNRSIFNVRGVLGITDWGQEAYTTIDEEFKNLGTSNDYKSEPTRSNIDTGVGRLRPENTRITTQNIYEGIDSDVEDIKSRQFMKFPPKEPGTTIAMSRRGFFGKLAEVIVSTAAVGTASSFIKSTIQNGKEYPDRRIDNQVFDDITKKIITNQPLTPEEQEYMDKNHRPISGKKN
jgi:hypothetical protein